MANIEYERCTRIHIHLHCGCVLGLVFEVTLHVLHHEVLTRQLEVVRIVVDELHVTQAVSRIWVEDQLQG